VVSQQIRRRPFWGALVQVDTTDVSYHRMSNRLDTMLTLILAEGDH